jgi:hypothetical protein
MLFAKMIKVVLHRWMVMPIVLCFSVQSMDFNCVMATKLVCPHHNNMFFAAFCLL